LTYPKTATGQELSSFIADKVLEGVLSLRDIVGGVYLLIVREFLAGSGTPVISITFHKAHSIHKLKFILGEEFLGGSVQGLLHAGYAVLLKAFVDALSGG